MVRENKHKLIFTICINDRMLFMANLNTYWHNLKWYMVFVCHSAVTHHMIWSLLFFCYSHAKKPLVQQ